jgi:hypothetical protein
MREGMRPFGKIRHRRKDNIKMDVELILVAQSRGT